MTPEEARDLVASFEGRRLAADYETYGLADGYQHVEHYVILEIDGEHPETGEPDVWADTLGMPDKATADMIAAAPTLAALAAGMRAEYRAEYQATGGRWFPVPRCCSCSSEEWGTKQQAERNAAAWKADGYASRLVRRYVTEPEDADATD